jgi:flagellar motor protein MotB
MADASSSVPDERGGGVETAVLGGVPLVLGVSSAPLYFSPDGDGSDDTLYIALEVAGGDVSSWELDILEPELSRQEGGGVTVLKKFRGEGIPSQTIAWDGIGDARQVQTDEGGTTEFIPRAQSATDYPYRFTVTDADGNVSAPVTGTMYVDILVTRTADGRLRIRVPSIIFRPNASDFEGLDEATVRNNLFIISRIAENLNKFRSYNVRIEGHANPVYAPGTAARAREEAEESAEGSVSEQRALMIMELLAQDGVARRRMTAVGMGVSTPAVEFANQEASWQNRRVELYLER